MLMAVKMFVRRKMLRILMKSPSTKPKLYKKKKNPKNFTTLFFILYNVFYFQFSTLQVIPLGLKLNSDLIDYF
jgi:hypothetical protein